MTCPLHPNCELWVFLFCFLLPCVLKFQIWIFHHPGNPVELYNLTNSCTLILEDFLLFFFIVYFLIFLCSFFQKVNIRLSGLILHASHFFFFGGRGKVLWFFFLSFSDFLNFIFITTKFFNHIFHIKELIFSPLFLFYSFLSNFLGDDN